MDENEQVIEAIVDAAKGAESPKDLSATGVDDELFEAATEAFGGWDTALAAGLLKAVSGGRKSRRKAAVADVERKVTEAFEHPIYVETSDGKLFSFHGPELEVDEKAQLLDEAGLAAAVRAIHYVGDAEAVYLFSDQGRFFGIDRRMIPSWSMRGERRSIRDTLFLTKEEGIRAVVPRRQMATGRVVHVTRGGKAKATDATDYGDGLDRSGRTAFKVRDGDVPIAVFGIGRETTIFCASALGRGIHFEASELRSMGRKAMGVNAMKLADDDDAIVGAFEGKRVRQVAVITAEGLGKRVDFSEFRTQGRNGRGMQLARLNPGDHIAGAVACNPAEDLAVTSSDGRVWRLPAGSFHLMGRPAKGNRMVDLDDKERVIDLAALPCGG